MPPPMLMPTGMLPPTPMALLPMPLPTLLVATPTSGRGRLRPSLAMATDVEDTVATDVADMARGRPRLSPRPTPSSMEDTMATLLPSPTPAMLMPPPTPMALLPMPLPTLLVPTPTSGRGRLRPSLAMATDVEATVATDVAGT